MTSTNSVNPQELLPLTPAIFHILLALADGDKHGYSIMQEVEDATDGTYKLWPGTLYSSIKRLLEQGAIVESDDRPDPEIDDQRRRYYHLTDFGQKVITAEARRLETLVSLAQSKQLLAGKSG